jgi:hypothetical protein
MEVCIVELGNGSFFLLFGGRTGSYPHVENFLFLSSFFYLAMP